MRLKHFRMEEFQCPCCGKEDMDLDLLENLDALRGRLGTPLVITSGYRCKAHNKAVGGARKTKNSLGSMHLYGKAVDIAAGAHTAYRIITLANQYGFRGIGVQQKGSGRFIHLDNRSGPEVVWSY